MKKTSEFGKGFVYNLILFAKHFENSIVTSETMGISKWGCWFNGASDHLFELEIPEQFVKTPIGIKAKELQELSLDIGHGDRMMSMTAEKDFKYVVNLTKEIAMLIDRELGIDPVKGDYE